MFHQASPKKTKLTRIIFVFLALTYLITASYQSLLPSRNNVALRGVSLPMGSSLSVAVISDLHIPQTRSAYDRAAEIFKSIRNETPDLIFVLGDLISSPRGITSRGEHRKSILTLLETLPKARTLIVLGNYESLDDRTAWLTGLKTAGFNVLENQVMLLETNEGPVCVRGLGDSYSNHYAHTPLPPECEELPTMTITHDPAAVFKGKIEGLAFAGHTHCGQISLPFLGPIWAPTDAPKEAWCGLYQDELRTLWTSSGIGTSILPIRLGAPSQWDLIEINPR